MDHSLSCLSVTLVCCGQTVGWIKMALGTEVCLNPGYNVLDGGSSSPPQKGHSSRPLFGLCLLVAKRWPISETAELLF